MVSATQPSFMNNLLNKAVSSAGPRLAQLKKSMEKEGFSLLKPQIGMAAFVGGVTGAVISVLTGGNAFSGAVKGAILGGASAALSSNNKSLPENFIRKNLENVDKTAQNILNGLMDPVIARSDKLKMDSLGGEEEGFYDCEGGSLADQLKDKGEDVKQCKDEVEQLTTEFETNLEDARKNLSEKYSDLKDKYLKDGATRQEIKSDLIALVDTPAIKGNYKKTFETTLDSLNALETKEKELEGHKEKLVKLKKELKEENINSIDVLTEFLDDNPDFLSSGIKMMKIMISYDDMVNTVLSRPNFSDAEKDMLKKFMQDNNDSIKSIFDILEKESAKFTNILKMKGDQKIGVLTEFLDGNPEFISNGINVIKMMISSDGLVDTALSQSNFSDAKKGALKKFIKKNEKDISSILNLIKKDPSILKDILKVEKEINSGDLSKMRGGLRFLYNHPKAASYGYTVFRLLKNFKKAGLNE